MRVIQSQIGENGKPRTIEYEKSDVSAGTKDLDLKYQRHLEKDERIRLYTEFMNQDGIGSLVGAHLGWSKVELLVYLLEDCGFSKEEIKSITTPPNN